MDNHDTVTHWISQLQAGERDAAQKLWERYFAGMVKMARGKLEHAPRRAADEEDVAQVAFNSFCLRAEQGRFPDLRDRHQLWNLLLTITERKAANLIRHEGQGKRDWRQTAERNRANQNESDDGLLVQQAGREPDPQFAAAVAEELQQLLDKLDTDELRAIALSKMEGHTNQEIAESRNCAVPTIERRLRMIRRCWERETEQ